MNFKSQFHHTMEKRFLNQPVKLILKGFLYALLCSITYSFVVDVVIIPSGLYSGGYTGITQVITYSIFAPDQGSERKTWFYVIYFCLNIPTIIFSFWKIGFWFTINTIIFMAMQNVWNVVWILKPIRDLTILTDILQTDSRAIKTVGLMIYSVVAGFCWAISYVLIYHGNGCGGGTDVITMYLAIWRKKSVGKYQRIITIVVIIIAVGVEYAQYNSGNYSNLFYAYFANPVFYGSIFLIVVSSSLFNRFFPNLNVVKLKITSLKIFILLSTMKKDENIFQNLSDINITNDSLTLICTWQEWRHIKHLLKNIDNNANYSVVKLSQFSKNVNFPKYK